MSGDVLTFPGARPRDSDKPRAMMLAERITGNLANETPDDCADALTRVLAAICCVNAINVTEAIEMAQMMAMDLEGLVRQAKAAAI